MKKIYTRSILSLSIFFLSILIVNGQCSEWSIIRNDNGTAQKQAHDMARDFAGNIILTGQIGGVTGASVPIGDTILINTGFFDYFIAKYNANGDFIWARSGGNTIVDMGSSVTTDAVGNIYVTGKFTTSINFDAFTLTTSSGNTQIFVVKYSPAGQVLWAQQSEGPGGKEATDIKIDNLGNVYAIGYNHGNDISFGGITVPHGFSSPSGYFVKFDNNGIVQWANTLDFDLAGEYRSLMITASNDIYITGSVFGTKTVIGIPVQSPSMDIMLLKYNNSGVLQDIKTFGDSKEDVGTSITNTPSGEIVIGAYFFSDTLKIGSDTLINQSTVNKKDAALINLSSTGVPIWSRTVQGSSDEEIVDLTTNSAGVIYSLGSTTSNDAKIETSNTGSSVLFEYPGTFLATYSSTGNLQWLKSGTAAWPRSVALDTPGNSAIIAGFYSWGSDFGDLHLSGGQYSFFILKASDISNMMISNIQSTNSSPCSYSDNGSIIYSVIGGSPPYLYALTKGTDTLYNNTGIFNSLAGGNNYTPHAFDQNGCLKKLSTIYISEPSQIYPIKDQFTDSVYRNQTGVIYSLVNTLGSTYQWIMPSGAVIVSGQGTNAIEVNFQSFTGGLIQTIETRGACTSDTVVFVIESKPANYAIEDLDILCKQNIFSIPINSPSPSVVDVLGLDFCMEYDTLLMTPTGTATLGDVVHGGNPTYANYYLNISIPGEIYGVIYYTAQAPFPTFFGGNGLVIDIDFIKNPGVAAGDSGVVKMCGVTEGTLNNGSIEEFSGLTSRVRVVNDSIFNGSVHFWNKAGRPLIYDSGNPSANIETQIIGSDSLCVPIGGYVVPPDSTGFFNFSLNEASYLSIERDIPGDYGTLINCTNVMTNINGADQNLVLKIATNDISLLPSVYQVIAADVNLDGLVSAVDVSLMSARSVMSICGFPNNGASASVDWLFISQSSVDTLDEYQISSVYPSNDGSGFSKNNIPIVPNCFEIPQSAGPICIEAGSEDYGAILLGDVNGSWKTIDGVLMKKAFSAKVVLNFDEAYIEMGKTIIPVQYESEEEITSLDLNFLYESTGIEVIELERSQDNSYIDLQSNWNSFNSLRFLLSSYSTSSLQKYGEPFKLVFNTELDEKQIQAFAKGEAFINGKKASLEVQIGNITGIEVSKEETGFLVYPNPGSDFITIKLLGTQLYHNSVELLIFNMNGQAVYNNKIDLRFQTATINISDLPSGIYSIQLKVEKDVFINRLVK